jgi:hypothetical protein
MMEDAELLALLRSTGRGSPSEVAELLGRHREGRLTQSAVVFGFKRAFPEIPLRVLLEAGEWSRLSGGDKSADWFDELLAPWMPSGDRSDT